MTRALTIVGLGAPESKSRAALQRALAGASSARPARLTSRSRMAETFLS